MFGKESVIPEILVERLGLSILNGILEGTSMTSSIFIRLCLHCYRVAFVIKEHELLFQRRTLCFHHRWRPSPHWSMMGARQLGAPNTRPDAPSASIRQNRAYF